MSKFSHKMKDVRLPYGPMSEESIRAFARTTPQSVLIVKVKGKGTWVGFGHTAASASETVATLVADSVDVTSFQFLNSGRKA